MGNSKSKHDKEITKYFKEKREKVLQSRTLTKEQIQALDYFLNHEEKCQTIFEEKICFHIDEVVPIMGIGLLQDDKKFLETEKNYFKYLENQAKILKDTGEIPTKPKFCLICHYNFGN